jgi:hypothetical protein
MCKDGNKCAWNKDILPKQTKKGLTPEHIKLTNELFEKLSKRKSAIVSEDGVAKINPGHPDYSFWTEE